jgi:hypothetical protein
MGKALPVAEHESDKKLRQLSSFAHKEGTVMRNHSRGKAASASIGLTTS